MTRRGELTPTDGACQNNVNSEYTEEGINAIYQLSNGDMGKYLIFYNQYICLIIDTKSPRTLPVFPIRIIPSVT